VYSLATASGILSRCGFVVLSFPERITKVSNILLQYNILLQTNEVYLLATPSGILSRCGFVVLSFSERITKASNILLQ